MLLAIASPEYKTIAMDNTEDKAVNTILMTDALWKRGESLKIHVDRMPAAMPLRCYAVCREGKRRKVLTARISGDEPWRWP